MPSSVWTAYCNNPEQSGSSAGLLDFSAPAASTSTTGWTVANTVTNRHSRQTFRTEKASGTFSSTTQPNGPPLGKAMDCWRISAVTTGQFSAGTWYSQVSVIGVTSGGAQDGRAKFRLWASPNVDGTSSFSELASDDFNRADENPITGNWTSGPDTFGDMQIVGTDVRGATGGGTNAALWNAVSWPADQYSEVKVTGTAGAGGFGGAFVRLSNASGYYAEIDQSLTSINLFRIRNLTFTSLQQINTTVASGDSIGLQCIGTTLRVYKNRTQVGNDSVDTFITSGSAGMGADDNSSAITITNWSGGAPTLRELTQGIMDGTTVTNLSTTVAQTSSASTQITTSGMTSDFLFMQVAWERTGAGGATTADVLVRLGPLDIGNGSGLVTPTFTTPSGGGGGGGTGTPYYYQLNNNWFATI